MNPAAFTTIQFLLRSNPPKEVKIASAFFIKMETVLK